jgi:hypothetical protein
VEDECGDAKDEADLGRSTKPHRPAIVLLATEHLGCPRPSYWTVVAVEIS